MKKKIKKILTDFRYNYKLCSFVKVLSGQRMKGLAMSKSKKNVRKIEIGQKTIDKIVKRRTFNPPENSQTGNRLIRLKKPGESIIGFLGWPITNFREATSYPIQLESGEVVEIIGNRLLHKLIKENDLCGQKVEIVYQGRDYCSSSYPHYRKIYRIYKYEQPIIFSKQDWNKILKQAKERSQNAPRKTPSRLLS